jgi:D-glycerate 3-kinase
LTAHTSKAAQITLVQLKPKAPPTDISQYAIVYKWRLEQEHHMKALNGGKGMDDAAVKSSVRDLRISNFFAHFFFRFVDRYIPGYVFFSRPPDLPSVSGHGLIVVLDETRTVAETFVF